MTFANKVVIVTGGAKGIGKGIVQAYAKRDAKVVIVDIDEKAGKQFEDEIIKQGKTALYLRCDVRKVEEIEHVSAETNRQLGTIDILINNAGVSQWLSPYEITVEQWDDVIHSNLRACFFFSREAAKVMRKQKKGSIVNIASTRAFMSEPNSEAYTATKGGIISLTHALAASFQEDGIQVNAISPGWIETGSYDNLRKVDHDQHFSKRVGKPEDIAKACIYLTDETNDFITGTNITIDGGMTKKMMYEE